MLKKILILFFIFVAWPLPGFAVDCSSLALKFSQNPGSLSIDELAQLRHCIKQFHGAKRHLDESQKPLPGARADCSSLALKFSQNPGSLSTDELAQLKQCVNNKLRATLFINGPPPAEASQPPACIK